MNKGRLYWIAYSSILLALLCQKESFSQPLKGNRSASADSILLTQLIQKASGFASSQPDSALYYYHQADSLCSYFGQENRLLDYFSNYSWVLNNQNQFEKSMELCNRALEISIKNNDKESMAYSYGSIGLVYVNKANYRLALENYFKAVALFESLQDTKKLCALYSNISGCYFPLKLFEKSLEYEEKSMACLEKSKDSVRLMNSYFNTGLVLKELGRFEKAYDFYRRAATLNMRLKEMVFECRLQYALASLMNARQNYSEAIRYAQRGIQLGNELNFVSGIALSMAELGKTYMNLRKFNEARNYLLQSIELCSKHHLSEELQVALDQIRFVEAALGDINASKMYDSLYRKIADSIFNWQASRDLQEMETKYNSLKNEQEILRLKDEKKLQELSLQKKNVLNYIFLGFAVVLLVISFLAYLNYKQKQKLQQQRISELETEKKLLAAEAILKGEEKERSRLAKDLHDGLGGMLSGIKFSLNTMKGNLVMTPDNAQAFERSMDMLDSSIMEMRRVAHNMMPEALVKFGLDTALKDFCYDINQTGAVQINYQALGLENKQIEQTVAITVYRIIQELINNTLKHAAAKNIVVQVSYNPGHFTITVEDDGKGFDISTLESKKGMGWSNIQNRVEFLKGHIDLKSNPEQGTSYFIEFPLP